ncbi:cell division protein ZapA [Chachezhania antarctica]|uniref:cell division protein ZapA n=1 Tax=Chachezhania antarctica TaxID=2340860 RepID=UPI000EB542F1|nr:cell division protein ZapA [Chachezhania antarctica]|tara:strand:+ start:608 stop:1012 length:405 start_codon:yes stop_codon:yes gene_type:complete
MPEITIEIGGRGFDVACQPGEEPFLRSAAKMLDDEAQVLSDQIGRMPEARMLLMAGLLLADKTAAVEDRIKDVEAQLAARDAELEKLKSAPPPEPVKVEVPVVPEEAVKGLAAMADEAEKLAGRLEARIEAEKS